MHYDCSIILLYSHDVIHNNTEYLRTLLLFLSSSLIVHGIYMGGIIVVGGPFPQPVRKRALLKVPQV